MTAHLRRALLSVVLLCLPESSCAPIATAASQAPPRCASDAECILVDACGCSCRAERGPARPPMACSEACGGHPCEGHRAICRGGTCVMDPPAETR
jgi:hypothetical protein